MLRAQRADISTCVLEGSEVNLLAAIEIHAVNVEIFVTAIVLRIQQVFAVEGESEIAHAALAVVGDDFRLIWVFARSYEHVEHALVRRNIAEPVPVRADMSGRALRVAEQDVARNQRRW